MISSTGNKATSLIWKRPINGKRIIRKRGFSFVEVMVALAILSGGIVLIYKSFLISFEYIHHLSCRSYAMTILDNKINDLQQIFAAKKEIPFQQNSVGESAMINNRLVYFRYQLDFKVVGNLKNIYQLDIALDWDEGSRHKKFTRQVYISHFNQVPPEEKDSLVQ